MNLSTDPVLTAVRVGALVANPDGRIDPHLFEIEYGSDGVDAAAALPTVLATIRGFGGRCWVVNGYSDPEFDTTADQFMCRRFRQPLLGSFAECVHNELALAVWETLGTKGLDAVAVIKVREITEGIRLAALGSVDAFTLSYEFGEAFKETCDTCTQGRDLLRYGEEWLNGSIVFGEGPNGFAFGDTYVSQSFFERASKPVRSVEDHHTIANCAKRLFTEANAGAMEMAHITQVNLFGV